MYIYPIIYVHIHTVHIITDAASQKKTGMHNKTDNSMLIFWNIFCLFISFSMNGLTISLPFSSGGICTPRYIPCVYSYSEKTVNLQISVIISPENKNIINNTILIPDLLSHACSGCGFIVE